MSDIKSETSEGPENPDQDDPDPSKLQFDELYEKYSKDSRKLECYARYQVPAEDLPDVMSVFWGFKVWHAVQEPKNFQGKSESDTSGLLFVILKATIAEYYRSRPKIMKAIAGSLDDESATDAFEASYRKQQDEQQEGLIRRHSLRELLQAAREQCLTNEKQLMIFYRDLDGKKGPPEGWTSNQAAGVRFRMHERMQKPLAKMLGKVLGKTSGKTSRKTKT